MLTLNANFEAALRRPNKPSFLVKLVQSEIINELSSQSDWLAGRSIGVDLTTEPGSVRIPSTTPTGITQNSYNTTLCLGSVSLSYPLSGLSQSPAVPGTDSFVWQSVKQSSGQNRYVNKVRPHLYATGSKSQYNAGWTNTFYVQLFDAKGGTAISTLKEIGGAGYTVDGQVEVDFSAENIPWTSGTTYWMKIYAISSVFVAPVAGSYATAASYVRYHSTTSTYADGQMDGKPYSGSESVNCGDLAFTVTFLNQYAGTGFVTNMIDLGAAPSVAGEFRVDKLTPLDSYVNSRVSSMTAIDSLEQTTQSNAASYRCHAYNGSRMVRGLTGAPYAQYSDDFGVTWHDGTGFGGSSAGLSTMSWSGRVFAATEQSGPGTIIWVSSDGASWSSKTLPSLDNWNRVKFVGDYFFVWIAGGGSSDKYAYSDVSGETWSAGTFPTSRAWMGLDYGGGVYCFVGFGDTNAAATSTIGTGSWTSHDMPANLYWRSVAYGAGIFVATAADTGTGYATSSDGASWTGRNFTGSFASPVVTFNGSIFMVVAYNPTGGTVTGGYSLTGTTWAENNSWTRIGTYDDTVTVVGPRFFVGDRAGGANRWYSYPGHTDLGLLSDGDALPSGYQYFSVTNYVAPDATGSWTPTLRSATLFFPTWLTLASTEGFGYEVAVNSVAALQSSIDTFEETKTGQMTLNLALTQAVSNWLATANPLNKEVRIYAGFVGLAEADFVSYYRGSVGDWEGIDDKFTVSIPVQDFNKTWKGVPVPATWQVAGAPPSGDDRVYTAVHPVDVMLEIMQGDIGVLSNALMGSSFGVVKDELSGWVVSNTLTGKTFDAKELLEELRFITGTYFIPQTDGRTKLKRWDPDEAAVISITDAELLKCKYKGNSAKLKNLINWYYNIDTEGVGKSGGIALYQTQDGASRYNNKETKIVPFDDHWTLTAQGPTQVQPVANALLTRYAAIPDGFDVECDLRFFALELADMISLTTKKAPSTDLTGISNVKYQIVRKNLDFAKSRIKFEFLRAA